MSPSTQNAVSGRRVLLIAPRFFNYDAAIAAELTRQGARVDALPDRPFNSPWYHAAARFAAAPVRNLMEGFYRRYLRKFEPGSYDAIFIINGQTVSRNLVKTLRATHPDAEFIFYLWDSLANRKHALELIPLFDRCYSFDPLDAKAYGLRFRPLFFDASAAPPVPAPKRYDISFIGTAHSDRHRVIEKLDRSLEAKTERLWYLYLQAPWVLWVYRLVDRNFRHARKSQFHFFPMARERAQDIFRTSRAILDIEHPRQTGLTMRTLETIGAGKKLVTTNGAIRDYALYDPQFITVIDRDNPVVPADFLETDAPPLPEELRDRYSIAGWVAEVFDPQELSSEHLNAKVW